MHHEHPAEIFSQSALECLGQLGSSGGCALRCGCQQHHTPQRLHKRKKACLTAEKERYHGKQKKEISSVGESDSPRIVRHRQHRMIRPHRRFVKAVTPDVEHVVHRNCSILLSAAVVDCQFAHVVGRRRRSGITLYPHAPEPQAERQLFHGSVCERETVCILTRRDSDFPLLPRKMSNGSPGEYHNESSMKQQCLPREPAPPFYYVSG